MKNTEDINQVAKTANFEPATDSATQHLFVLSLLMKFEEKSSMTTVNTMKLGIKRICLKVAP